MNILCFETLYSSNTSIDQKWKTAKFLFRDLCFFCAFESPPNSATLHPIHRRRTHTSNVSQRVMRMWFAIWRTPERQKETVLQFNMGRKTPDWQRHKELLRWSLRQSERPLDKPIIVLSPFFFLQRICTHLMCCSSCWLFPEMIRGWGRCWTSAVGESSSWQEEYFSADNRRISLPGKKTFLCQARKKATNNNRRVSC